VPPPPNPRYLEFLAPFDPHIRELALATRALVLETAPESKELIYDAYNAVASGFTFTGRPSDAFVHIAVYAKWVNLGFNRGSELDDPQKKLQGSGRWVRHLRIMSVEDLNERSLRAFLKAAVSGARRSAEPGSHVSVVRAVYPKRRRPASR
jgi:hypothetical protein